jgi:VWFA-related protein
LHNISAASNQPPNQGQPPVTFRVEINYVEVDAFVTDAQGNIVSDLTANDFELLEDGKPQKISTFSLVNLPIERASGRCSPARRSKPTCRPTRGRGTDLSDRARRSAHRSDTRAARQGGRASLHRAELRHQRSRRVVVHRRRSTDSQDFTNNPRLLLAAIDKFSGRKLRSATLERLENVRTNPDTGNVGPGDRPERDRARIPRPSGDVERAEARRVHGRRARATQGDALHQRGCGLRHQSGDGSAGLDRDVGAAGHPGRDRRGHARQRRHLHDRSARSLIGQ